jgi:hypothetical protein
MGDIFFYVVLLLMLLSSFAPDEWRWGRYAYPILTFIALLLLGLKVFGFKL